MVGVFCGSGLAYMAMKMAEHPHFWRVADGIDVAPVLADLDRHPELWDSIPNRTMSPDSPHHGSTDIWVRYGDIKPAIESGDWSVMRQPHEAIWYPAWYALPSLHKIVDDLVDRVNGTRIGGIWITRVPPGGGIRKHKDFGWHCDTFDKFYLSLTSAPGADFCCEHAGIVDRLNMKPGEWWLFDNHKPHWVENDTDIDRLTLIACVETAKFNEYHGRT